MGGGISLKLLIEEGLLEPGEGVLVSEYKGANMIANLNPDGRISYTVRSQLHGTPACIGISICICFPMVCGPLAVMFAGVLSALPPANWSCLHHLQQMPASV